MNLFVKAVVFLCLMAFGMSAHAQTTNENQDAVDKYRKHLENNNFQVNIQNFPHLLIVKLQRFRYDERGPFSFKWTEEENWTLFYTKGKKAHLWQLVHYTGFVRDKPPAVSDWKRKEGRLFFHHKIFWSAIPKYIPEK